MTFSRVFKRRSRCLSDGDARAVPREAIPEGAIRPDGETDERTRSVKLIVPNGAMVGIRIDATNTSRRIARASRSGRRPTRWMESRERRRKFRYAHQVRVYTARAATTLGDCPHDQ